MILTVPADDRRWRPTLGPLVCAFIEQNLVFGPGDLRGRPARLDEERRALIYRMYEVYPQGDPLAGRRRFKRAGLSLAKGLAKTEFAAWIAACELHPEAPVRCDGFDRRGNPLGRPVIDPYIPLVAYTQDQSDELAYGALIVILEEGPLRHDFDIGLERIMRRSGDGKAVSLSSSPKARDGARTTFSVLDETHWWTLPRLKKAHQTMMNNLAKRKAADPWSLEITTAPEPGSGSVAEDTMRYAQAVREGRVKDAHLFFFHRQASDKHDLKTQKGARAAVREASGAAKSWRDINAILELWRDPTTDRNFWERVWCNRLVRSSEKAFDPEAWRALQQRKNPVGDGDPIALGFDGAMFSDATGLVATHLATGYQWVMGIWECPFGQEDWQVPTQDVDETVRAAFTQYTVVRMYADPPYWQSWLSKWAGEFGEKIVISWWTNRRKAMSYALQSFQTAIRQREISHDGHEALARHIGNAHKQELSERNEEGRALWLIRKERSDSVEKIDLAMAAVLSWEARNDAIASGKMTPDTQAWGPAAAAEPDPVPAAPEDDFIPIGYY